jgi:hypothetical protein
VRERRADAHPGRRLCPRHDDSGADAAAHDDSDADAAAHSDADADAHDDSDADPAANDDSDDDSDADADAHAHDDSDADPAAHDDSDAHAARHEAPDVEAHEAHVGPSYDVQDSQPDAALQPDEAAVGGQGRHGGAGTAHAPQERRQTLDEAHHDPQGTSVARSLERYAPRPDLLGA